jgi:hypothetical protein
LELFQFQWEDWYEYAGGLTSLPNGTWPPTGEQGVTSAINAIFNMVKDGTTWTFFIDALKEAG